MNNNLCIVCNLSINKKKIAKKKSYSKNENNIFSWIIEKLVEMILR